MIQLENVRVTFNKGTLLERQALQDVTLSIGEEEFVTVIGSNGAGKSTLLNVLTGNIITNEGRVMIADQDVTKWPVEKRARLVARVFQDPLEGTCGALTVEENLALAAMRGKNRGLSMALNKKNRELFRDTLARLGLGLENRLRQPIGLLSGGQRQSISLMMAVLSPMEILVLDEHTAALDPRTAAAIIQLTKSLVEEKKLTVLMVTHSMHQALEVGTRTLMMHTGRVLHDLSEEARRNLSSADLLRLFEELDPS
ncbi:MAG: ABC transporter ATP-binding protein [Alphaproteobacteria bacterium]|jgi:putative ABC transport system ATP-binding protein|nr:ABC transporter ATP-binding protein [Alphaproteobacteria bacterium]